MRVIKPLSDRVVVMPDTEGEKQIGSIIVPDMSQEQPTTGTVLAVGPGKIVEGTGKIVPVSVSVGDTVIYGKYAGLEVDHPDPDVRATVRILRESDVLAVVQGVEPKLAVS